MSQFLKNFNYLSMKKLLSIFAALLFCVAAFAQENETNSSEPSNQLSLNVTSFISNYLTFNPNGIVSNSPYIITYKHLVDGAGLRLGLGGNLSSTSQNPNNGQTLSKTNTMDIDVRLGFEMQERLNKRWLFYYGADVRYAYDLTRTTSSSVGGFPPQQQDISSETEAFTAGAGPVLGIEFKLGKRISINTETTAYANYRERRRRITNPNFGAFNTNEFNAIRNFNIIIPTSVFFVLHF